MRKYCRCGVVTIPSHIKMCDKCVAKQSQYNSYRRKQRYAKDISTHYRLYNTKRWIGLRDSVLRQFKGMCVYSWMENKQLVSSGKLIVHHIEESTEDNFFDADNLIVLSHEVHEYVHSVYDYGTSDEVLELKSKLREYRCKFLAEMS